MPRKAEPKSRAKKPRAKAPPKPVPFVSAPAERASRASGLSKKVLQDFAEVAFAGQIPAIFQPDDRDAPALPFSDDEPAPAPKVVVPDVVIDPIATLERLAGPVANPQRAHRALVQALRQEPYATADLPELKHFLLGMCRVMVAHGVAEDDLVAAILDAMKE